MVRSRNAGMVGLVVEGAAVCRWWWVAVGGWRE